MNPSEFVSILQSMSFEYSFNPYSDKCEVYDAQDAPNIRATILRKMLDAATQQNIHSLWVGRDLGHRGGRRTGLSLTDDVHLSTHTKRWGFAADKPTVGGSFSERTATVVWNILMKIYDPVFLWNVFPLHPYEPGNHFSNRQHNAKERKAGEDLLFCLISILRPLHVVAIGNDAANSVRKICGRQKIVHVRHPSYGGQSKFLHQIEKLYDLYQPHIF